MTSRSPFFLAPWRLGGSPSGRKPAFADDWLARGRCRLGEPVKKIPNAIPLAEPARGVHPLGARGRSVVPCRGRGGNPGGHAARNARRPDATVRAVGSGDAGVCRRGLARWALRRRGCEPAGRAQRANCTATPCNSPCGWHWRPWRVPPRLAGWGVEPAGSRAGGEGTTRETRSDPMQQSAPWGGAMPEWVDGQMYEAPSPGAPCARRRTVLRRARNRAGGGRRIGPGGWQTRIAARPDLPLKGGRRGRRGQEGVHVGPFWGRPLSAALPLEARGSSRLSVTGWRVRSTVGPRQGARSPAGTGPGWCSRPRRSPPPRLGRSPASAGCRGR